MRLLTSSAALLLAGPCLSSVLAQPCASGAGNAVVITEGPSPAHVSRPCSAAPIPPAPLPMLTPPPAPTPHPVATVGTEPEIPLHWLQAASYNPARPAPANPTEGLRVTQREYDAFDRIKSETVELEDGSQTTISYTYWGNGLRKTLTDAQGRVTFYEYDSRNLLSRVTVNQGSPDAQITTYEYWPDDLLKTIRRPNGTETAYDYDRADRVVSIVVTKGQTRLSAYSYEYDANGNRTSQIEENGGPPETTLYEYDQLHRLKVVRYPDGRSVTYGYDAVGNRVAETERNAAGTIVSNKTALFDAINRLSTVTDSVDPAGNATFTYDRNGNLLTKTTAAGTQRHVYDVRNLLVETLESEAIAARFAYDAFGRRHLKIGAEGVRQYLYDQTSLLEELDENDQEVAKYEYAQDHLAAFFRRDEPRRYFHLDGLGSVTGLSDAGGDMLARYRLDAWGNLRNPSALNASKNRFAFTGYLFDRETDLYYAKARYYDPQLGRFLTQDSYLGKYDDAPSLHRYTYGHNRPTFFVDPTGHDVQTFMAAAAHGEGWNYFKSQVGQYKDRVKHETKELAGDIGMAISIGAARTLSMAIDPETGEISIFAPGDSPTPAYVASQPQPQNLREHRAALIADLGFTAAPLLTKALPKKEISGTIVESRPPVSARQQTASPMIEPPLPGSPEFVGPLEPLGPPLPEWKGPTSYVYLKDPADVVKVTKPTPRQVRQMKEANRAQNEGLLRDDVTGEVMCDSARCQTGVTPPPHEAQVDHVTPQSEGGTRSFTNLQLRTRKNNRDKWDAMPTPNPTPQPPSQ